MWKDRLLVKVPYSNNGAAVLQLVVHKAGNRHILMILYQLGV